jgi:hypothetical protein
MLDLFGHEFVALTDPAGKQSLDAAAARVRPTRIPLAVLAIDAAGWHDLYGVEPGGVGLVRPDGYVAWRSIGPPTTAYDLVNAMQIAAGRQQDLT